MQYLKKGANIYINQKMHPIRQVESKPLHNKTKLSFFKYTIFYGEYLKIVYFISIYISYKH